MSAVVPFNRPPLATDPMDRGPDAEDAGEEQQPRYSDAELATMVKALVSGSDAGTTTQFAEHAREAFEAYYGLWPGEVDGIASTHVSMDVFDGVEAIKTKLLRAFSQVRTPVKYMPIGPQDVQGAKYATEYVKRVFYRENAGYQNLSWALHDALLNKRCVFKIWSEDRVERIPRIFQDLPEEAYALFIDQQGEVESPQVTGQKVVPEQIQTPAGVMTRKVTTYDGTYVQVKRTKAIRIDVVPPENFFLDAASRRLDPHETRGCVERHVFYLGQLVDQGFDPEELEKVTGTDTGTTASQLLAQTRGLHVQRYTALNKTMFDQNERAPITGYVAHMMIDMDGDDAPELWKVIVARETVIHKEMVRKFPYRIWSPYTLSHQSIGMCPADTLKTIQRTNSNLIRGAVDHLYRSNNPVKLADLSGSSIKNPQDVINNPPGLVIDTSDPNSVTSLQQPVLNPGTFNVFEVMNQQKENRTGMSRLAQGLQPQAMGNQNAYDMIGEMMDASNERVLEIARSFAETCFRPMLEDIYELAYEEDIKIPFNNVKGQQGVVQLGPTDFGWRPQMDVEAAVTEEEQQRRATMLMALHKATSEDQQVAPLYGLKERYALYSHLYDLIGYPEPFLADPNDPNVQKMILQLGMEAQQDKKLQQSVVAAQGGLAQADAMTKVQRVQIEKQKVLGDQMLAKDKTNLQATTEAHAASLDEKEFIWQQFMDFLEYKLEREQQRGVALGGAGNPREPKA